MLDALHDAPIRFVSCRHEVGAANMADAYGKLTGRPGICMVTRGPGATHAAGGIHTAYQDSTPLILLIGQVGREMMEREAFQEIDYRQMFGPMAKWVAQIDSADRIPELVSRAFHVATSGRPGPVVLALPEDMLVDESSVADAAPYAITPRPRCRRRRSRRHGALLAGAERPLVIVGGAPWSAEANEALTRWCVDGAVPVASGWRCQDYVDNTADVYVGHLGLGPDPRLAQRVRDADVLLVIGDRLSEITTSGYTLLEVPSPAQALVHVTADPNEIGRVYTPALGIAPRPTRSPSRSPRRPPSTRSGRQDETARARADYLANLVHTPAPGALDMGDVMATLRERLPADAILTNGAGNFTVWAHRFYEFRQYRTQLAPTSGAMGYGVPAAIAAKILDPGRIVVCMAGDGDFLMTGQELATAVQENAAVVILVVNNGMYGTIRMHQERHYPGRVSGTDLVNPDFAALARAFGAHGAVVEQTADFAAALERGTDLRSPRRDRAAGRPGGTDAEAVPLGDS